ncbi:MAG: hypothetical protein Kow00127_00570 [Bacteroidales bacterium]
MRTTISFLAIAFIISMSTSCDKVKDEINDAASFEAKVDLPAQTIAIDSSQFKSVSEMKALHLFEVDVDLQKILDDNGLSSASFSQGAFQSVTVEIIAPEGLTYDFVKSMYVAVSMTGDFNDEVVVAQTGNIPSGSTSVTFQIEQVDITQFINEQHFWVGLFGDKTGPLPTSQVTLLLNSSVKFTVNPI